MRRQNICIDKSSYIIKSMMDGELLILGKYVDADIYFIYKYNDRVYALTADKMQPFVSAHFMSSHRYVKCKCDFSYIQAKLTEYDDSRTKYGDSLSYALKRGQVIDISGAALKPMDFVYVYDMKTLESELGLLIGTDQVLSFSGAVKRFNLCKKLTQTEIKNCKDRCDKLVNLYKSMVTDKVKKNVQEFKVGDVYKKGDCVSVYLGKAKLLFNFNEDTYNRELKTVTYASNTINVDVQPLKDYYANKNREKDLWFRMKMSDDSRLKNIVLNILNHEDVQLSMRGLYILMLCNMGYYKITAKCSDLYIVDGPISGLKYDLRNSSLGSYFMHWDITSKDLCQYTFRVKDRGERVCQCIKRSISFTIDTG